MDPHTPERFNLLTACCSASDSPQMPRRERSNGPHQPEATLRPTIPGDQREGCHTESPEGPRGSMI